MVRMRGSAAAVLILSLAAGAAAALQAPAGDVRPRLHRHRTPFGIRAGGCTLEVPSGSRIDELLRDGVAGVLVSRPLSPTAWEAAEDAFFYPTPPHCGADMAALLERRHTVMAGRQQQRRQSPLASRGTAEPPPPPYSGRPSKVWTPDNFTCSALPCDGWIDNAGWEINGEGKPFPLTIKQFNATYILPPVPPQRQAPPNCTFNYTSSDSCPGIAFFTGVENSDGWDRLCRECAQRHNPARISIECGVLSVPLSLCLSLARALSLSLSGWSNCSEPHGPLAHSILQPVLEYYDCPHPMDESYCARSWACCPYNVTVTSTALEGLQPSAP
eukprot:COSAG03_NODE_1109_length_4799_cov_192.408511_5_plen_329_part_00